MAARTAGSLLRALRQVRRPRPGVLGRRPGPGRSGDGGGRRAVAGEPAGTEGAECGGGSGRGGLSETGSGQPRSARTDGRTASYFMVTLRSRGRGDPRE